LISIVGSETLLGRELREALTEAGFGRGLQLIGAQDELSLSLDTAEPAVITPMDTERLQSSDVIF
jgi:hypothetical protein